MRIRKWAVVGISHQTGHQFGSSMDMFVFESSAHRMAAAYNHLVAGASFWVYRWDQLPAEVAHMATKPILGDD